MKNECDKCHGKIIDKKCLCGYWFEREDIPEAFKCFEKAIYAFDFLNQQKELPSSFGGDHEETGCCFLFFKGDYLLVDLLRKILYEIQFREGLNDEEITHFGLTRREN